MTREIDAVLRLHGFVRRNATWNRRSGQFVDLIDLQVSKSRDSVTMNAGVLHCEVYAKVWGSTRPEFVDAPSLTVGARLGQLLDGRDTWWAVEHLPTENELASLLTTNIIPFLEGLHSIEAMEQRLTNDGAEQATYPLPKLHLAVLRYERGDRASACALLLQILSSTSGAWQNRVKEIAERLGCPEI